MSISAGRKNERMYPGHYFYQSSQRTVAFLLSFLWYVGIHVFIGGCTANDTPAGSLSEPAGAAPKASVVQPENMAAAPAASELYIADKEVSRATEECCTDPGAIAACWWKDAESDGVSCTENAKDNCLGAKTCVTQFDGYTPPNKLGLCGCANADECNSGICATVYGKKVCAPSYCNGYSVCSCFGGCKVAQQGNYDTPKEMCEDESYPGHCCEGKYPTSPDGKGFGYCSDMCAATGNECTQDAQCAAKPVPVQYSADCVKMICDDGYCVVDYSNEDQACTQNIEVTNSDYYGTASRDPANGILSCFTGVCSSAGRCLSDPALAEGLVCDDSDGKPCTDEICRSGVCEHEFLGNVGNPCNNDNDACTLDRCRPDGDCEKEADKECDDGNLCTGDECVDNDVNHIDPTCVYPPKADGNAADLYNYSDTDVCSDLMCVSGWPTPTPTDCTGVNPDSLDLQCNYYSCDASGGEDNCTPSDLEGFDCSDGDACTVGDVCVRVGSNGVCESGPEMDCEDHNDCTDDHCSGGVCIHDPNVANPCSDGNACTLADHCDSTGACVYSSTVDCGGLDNGCTTNHCNPTSGSCDATFHAAGSSCDADGDPCTVDDYCDGSGKCMPGDKKDCSALDNVCNDGFCDPSDGLCKRNPSDKEGADCNADNSLCTLYDTCRAGVCTADTPRSCPNNDQCNIEVCEPTTGDCVFENASLVNSKCNLDDDGCTEETCQGAADGLSALACTSASAVSCDDGNPCTEDKCNSTGAYTHTCTAILLPNTTPCNADIDGCTQNDHCDGSGACVSGTVVTTATCEEAISKAHTEFNLDCNTAQCVSTGDNDYACEPLPLSPAPAAGSCDADNNGCTLDTCSGNDPTIGAVCGVGSELDCSASSNLPCLIGACVPNADPYSSSCGTSNADDGTPCNADSSGCTIDDECVDGMCTAGAAATCIPSGSCILSSCSSTGDNSYSCLEEADTDCCVNPTDCDGLVDCGPSPICNVQSCEGGICDCVEASSAVDCSAEVEAAAYPENCYESLCNGTGDCLTEILDTADVDNNLCSDLFDPATPTTFNTSGTGYLGAFTQASAEGTSYSATGSTLCSNNNYKALAANNCKESGTSTDLGSSGNDVAYGFTYQTEASTSRVDYAYLVKVEADFDVAVYAKNEISGATACPEGNNPASDVPGTCTITYPVTRLGSWVKAAGATGSATRTMTFTPSGTGNNKRLLVVNVEAEATAAIAINSVTYGGQAGTEKGTLLVSSATPYLRMKTYIFTESQIAARTDDTITVTLSSSTYSGLTIHAGMYDNVNQTTPVSASGVYLNNSTSAATLTTSPVVQVSSALVNFAATTDSTAGKSYTWTATPALTKQTDLIGVTATAGSVSDALLSAAATMSVTGAWSGSTGRVGQISMILSPSTSSAACVNTSDWTCSLPYTGASAVVEETCATGNGFAGQTCCDPCTGGTSCGYKWCERGYDLAGTACDLCAGTCDDYWEYPDGPYDCTSSKPSDSAYGAYTYKASTIIHPTVKDGSTKNALIYVDGSGGKNGNFYITVEKVPWVSSPCERIDDDVRITNATSVGAGGKTYYDTINDRANSEHTYTTSTCGGYDCTPTWSGNNACHSTSISANPFWPAETFYNIYSSSAATYCVTTSAPASNALDAVMTLYKTSGATDLCYEPLTYVDCARNNYLSSNEKMEFTALANTQYLIGISRYEGLNRPCLNSQGDNCDINVNIIQGSCPTACVALNSWYSGAGAPMSTFDASAIATTYTDATIGTIYRYLITGNTASRTNSFDIGAGWAGKDEVHRLNFPGASRTVSFSGCQYGGSGSYNGRMALYDCRGSLLASNDDGCGANGMPAFSYTMNSTSAPYYLVVDGKTATDNGAFNIAVYYAPTCTDGLKNGTETAVDCGGVSSGVTCPACPPTCTDGIQNGTEIGVDCGGVSSGVTCPACPCAVGRCKNDAACASTPSTPFCDTAAAGLDVNGCGPCTSRFEQCDSGYTTVVDGSSTSGALYSKVPFNGGCINMLMSDNQAEWNETANNNLAMKLQNPGGAYTGSCSAFPYTLQWHTTYCKTYNDKGTLRRTIDWSTNWLDYSVTPNVRFWYPTNCTEIGHLYGTQTVESAGDQIRIPVRRYAISMDINFTNTTTCAWDLWVYYDTVWGSLTTGLTCANANATDTYYTGHAVTCSPSTPW